MSCRSSRLPLSLSNISPSLAHSNSRYVCLQCRYRASLQKAPPRHPRNGTYSSLLLRRTYATGKKPAGRIEKFQDAVTVMLSKTFFKEGHQPHLEEQAEKADRPDQPPEDPVPAPVVDDPDYAPAVSGEDLETIGGPTGWWEEAWDAEHQYYGYDVGQSTCSSLRLIQNQQQLYATNSPTKARRDPIGHRTRSGGGRHAHTGTSRLPASIRHR